MCIKNSSTVTEALCIIEHNEQRRLFAIGIAKTALGYRKTRCEGSRDGVRRTSHPAVVASFSTSLFVVKFYGVP
jgi:hypothetical protein